MLRTAIRRRLWSGAGQRRYALAGGVEFPVRLSEDGAALVARADELTLGKTCVVLMPPNTAGVSPNLAARPGEGHVRLFGHGGPFVGTWAVADVRLPRDGDVLDVEPATGTERWRELAMDARLRAAPRCPHRHQHHGRVRVCLECGVTIIDSPEVNA